LQALSIVFAFLIVPARQDALLGLVDFIITTRSQMDFIEECFKENDGAFIEQLKGAGFSDYRARQFLPEAASGISDSTHNTGVEQITRKLVSGAPSQFLNSVNVAEIAENLGMNSNQVTKGLAAITPVLAQTFAQQSDGLLATLTSLTPGFFKRFS